MKALLFTFLIFIIVSCNSVVIHKPVKTSGIVDSVSRDHNGGGLFEYTIFYSYQASGERLFGEKVNSGNSYSNVYKRGDSLNVVYEKSDSTISTIISKVWN